MYNPVSVNLWIDKYNVYHDIISSIRPMQCIINLM